MAQSQTLTQFFADSRAFYKKHNRPTSLATTLESLVHFKHISEYNAKKYIQTNRIIVHHRVKSIAKAFLEYKKTHGTKIEKSVYAGFGWNLENFFVRLVKKRPLCFFGKTDETLLRDNKHFHDARKNWDLVGTDQEMQSIRMQDYLTYEEIMIASLIGVSGYTAYLNNGVRNNGGIIDFQGVQKEGIQIGLVGARFERSGRMDSLYRSSKIPASFISSLFPGNTFEQRYKSRMRISLETMLLEADTRGAAVKRKTWINIVGLGLGVWAPDDLDPAMMQTYYIECFADALQALKIHWIGTFEFAWMDKVSPQARYYVEKSAALSHTTVLWSKRPPSAKIADPSVLLVTTYAWDGNSYPGNEFYLGMLSASGDPAAAASSLISETQNPEINPGMLKSVVYLG